MEGIRYSDKLLRLLRLLAHQIGSEVSASELGRSLGMSKNTVDRYLDLLEKVFILHRVTGFSRNLRKELTRNPRFYFVDIGIRNALINNFNPLSLRDDVGALWENYVVLERMKRNEALGVQVSSHFWRTYDRQEIDLIEEMTGSLQGYEIKWNPKKGKRPGGWTAAYPDAGFTVIHRDNYLEHILP